MRRARTVFLVVVLVASLFAVGATGTVAAYEDWDSETCNENMGTGWTLTCTLAPGLAEPPQKTDHSDGFDARSTVVTANASFRSDASTFNRTAKRLEGALWGIGFSEYRDALNNGSSSGTAVQKANEAIEQHGVAELKAMAGKGNIRMRNLYSAMNQTDGTSDIQMKAGVGGGTNGWSYPVDLSLKNTTISHHNTSIEVYYLDHDYKGSWHPNHQNWQNSEAVKFADLGDYGGDATVPATVMTDFANSFSAIDQSITDAKNEISTFNSNFDESKHNISDVNVDPRTYAEQYSDTNSSGLAAGTLAMSGIDVDTQSNVTVRHNGGENITGLLGASEDLAPSLSNVSEGDTYDLSNLSGEALLIETDGSGDQHSWTDGTLEIVDTGGRTIEFEQRTLDTANVSETLDTLREIQQLQANATEWQSGGAGGGLGSGLLGGAGLLLALLAGGYLLMGRNGGGGRGRGGSTVILGGKGGRGR